MTELLICYWRLQILILSGVGGLLIGLELIHRPDHGDIINSLILLISAFQTILVTNECNGIVFIIDELPCLQNVVLESHEEIKR